MGTVIQLDMRVALILVGAFVGLVFGFGRLLLAQFEKRMRERFEALDKQREEDKGAHSIRVEAIENNVDKLHARISGSVAGVEKLRQSLPLEYVRREDWIRFASTIDAKLDRLADAINYRNRNQDRE